MSSKRILITGAGSGIGRDTALALAERGHRVFASTHTEAQAQALQVLAASRKLTLEAFKLDVTQAEDRQKAVPLQLDVLINNAGVGEGGSLAEVEVDRIRHVFDVNVFSALELTQLVLRGMIARESGTVIFVSSLGGRVPMRFMMPYSMSKFALSAAAAGLRAEMTRLGKGIQVSVIEPGAFHTGFNQQMAQRKLDSIGPTSFFSAMREEEKDKGERFLRLVELHDTRPIVNKLVVAAEAKRPKLRYVAPWFQGALVRVARILGV